MKKSAAVAIKVRLDYPTLAVLDLGNGVGVHITHHREMM
jgi:hypothetical protein